MPNILVIDIENSPNLAHVWSLWNNNVSLSQLQETGEIISFAAKWVGKKKVIFKSTFHDGMDAMLDEAHKLLSEADIVVGYNSKNFDMKHLNRAFIENGYAPPAPYAQVDLMHVVKSQFRFVSNKLDHVVQQLGLGKKTAHTGHDLWVRCMQGDAAAWALMRKYNKNDVVITEELYLTLIPWVPNHPNMALLKGVEGQACTNCASTNLQWRGYYYTAASKFRRFVCNDCSKWGRSSQREQSGSRGV